MTAAADIAGDLQVDLEERAAFLEFAGGMSRREADAQAAAEMRLPMSGTSPTGILAELIAAARLRLDPRLEPVLADVGLAALRAPCWGFAAVARTGDFYTIDEAGQAAVIAPATEAGLLADLVAQPLPFGRPLTRLGVATMLGADAIEIARETGQPLLVFSTVIAWLRGHTRGVFIIDWRQAAHDLDGVATLRCQKSIARDAHRATRRLRPPPKILVPEPSGGLRSAA